MNNRIVGIAGSALLIIGVFLPIISVFGMLTFSLFTFIQGGPAGSESMGDEVAILTLFRILGIVILLLGLGSLFLALKNQFKALIGTGIVSLCLLILIFIKLQSLFSTAPAEARAVIGVGWGFYVMVLGAIALIVAGVMKSTTPVVNPGYGAPPPPPYPPVQ